MAKYAGRENVASTATIEELGLSSLERVELMVALEDAFGRASTKARSPRRAASSDLQDAGRRRRRERRAAPAEPVEFPGWNRSWPGVGDRRVSLPTWILPLARVFAWMTRRGARAPGEDSIGPVIFAANHQSHMDLPVILAALPARLRYRVAPAMAKEFFKAHFFPGAVQPAAWFTNSLNYYLAALFFNAFPLPQREAGARQTLRYIGEVLESGFSVLIFPEGKRTDTRRDRPVPAGHRHDRVAAGRPGRAGAGRRARQGAAPHLEHGPARAASASPSARRCA